jgi:hypothetical protein
MITKLMVDIWSDIACPWCYVGKRRLESALQRFVHREAVEVTWRAFEINPGSPARSPRKPMCPPSRHVTNVHAAAPDASEPSSQALLRPDPDPRAHLGASCRASARTPITLTAPARARSVVGRWRVDEAGFVRRRTRVGQRVHADRPVWDRLAGDVEPKWTEASALAGVQEGRRAQLGDSPGARSKRDHLGVVERGGRER